MNKGAIAIIEIIDSMKKIYISDIQTIISSMRQCNIDNTKSIFNDTSNVDTLPYTQVTEPCTIVKLDKDNSIRVINDYGCYFEGKVINNWELFTYKTQGLYWTELPIDIVIIGYKKINNRYYAYVTM